MNTNREWEEGAGTLPGFLIPPCRKHTNSTAELQHIGTKGLNTKHKVRFPFAKIRNHILL